MNVKRLGLQSVRLHFGAFDHEMECIAGPWKNVARYVAWRFDEPSFTWNGSNSRGHYWCKQGYVPVIWIPRKPRTPREFGTLAHEVLHVIRQILVDWAGMPLNSDTDEAFCHAQGYAVTRILEGLK